MQGLASFPGISQIVEASFSFTTGITPSVATITLAPQSNFLAEVGTLTFSDGNSWMSWPNARVDSDSLERNSSGLVCRLSIYDRRWKWQSTGGGGYVCQGINLCNDDGSIIESTRMSAQQAAGKLLQLMDEGYCDVYALPSDQYPELIWDCSVPAQVLEQLAEQYGCRVVLSITNQVKICQVGMGRTLPIGDDVRTDSLGVTLPGMPSRIAVICAPDKFQVDLELEAVGLERDGTMALLNDLSYKPDNGWGDVDLEFFDEITDAKDNALAKKSVYRYYRVKFPINVKGYQDQNGGSEKISNAWQVRLEDSQVEVVTDDMGTRPKPAAVGGIFFDEDDGDNGNNVGTSDINPYQENPIDNDEDAEATRHQWQLGTEAQLGRAKDHWVVFDKPIYMNTNKDTSSLDIKMSPAKLVLRIACTLLDEAVYSPVRSYHYQDTGSGLNTPVRCEIFSDLQTWHYYDYKGGGVTDNAKDIKKAADYYIQQIKQQYQRVVSQTITYNGLKEIDLDGAIQHIHWKVGKSGCDTTASFNNEQIRHVQPWAQRMMWGKIKNTVRTARRKDSTLRTHKRSSQ